MTDGFWRVRIGRLDVYEWSLEEALHCAITVKMTWRAWKKGIT